VVVSEDEEMSVEELVALTQGGKQSSAYAVGSTRIRCIKIGAYERR